MGSIRIAVTAVASLDLDAETRTDMLTSAADESVRASAEVAAIGAYAHLLLAPESRAQTDVTAAVHDAAAMARLAGLDVSVSGPDGATALAASSHAALPTLIRLVAGATKRVSITISLDAERVWLQFDADENDALPPVADALIAAIGATREAAAGLTIWFGTDA